MKKAELKITRLEKDDIIVTSMCKNGESGLSHYYIVKQNTYDYDVLFYSGDSKYGINYNLYPSNFADSSNIQINQWYYKPSKDSKLVLCDGDHSEYEIN